MKNKEAFEDYCYENCYNVDNDGNIEIWKACEEFYESRRCDKCKSSTDDKNYLSSVHCCNAKSNSRLVDRDFYCKYWEGK